MVIARPVTVRGVFVLRPPDTMLSFSLMWKMAPD
jgi:hypothetical protein